ncbi:DEAD/DEAH box helicase [Bradyrhizobium cenepequi]
MAAKNNQPSLETLFELPEDYLRGPQPEALRPGLIEAVDRKTKQDRLLKFWPKTGTAADEELRDLWRHERLQVDRIMSYPGADEVFAGVVAMIETSDTFCIVHEPGSMPLEGKLRTAPKRFWMRNLSVPANRVVLWQNLGRLAKALGILHSHGLLHGRIDSYAVFTEGAQEADFRLGGFEWSLVLGEARTVHPPLQQVRTKIRQLTYSYAHDWKAIASLFASFIGIDPGGLRRADPYIDTDNPVELTDGEIDLLRRMIDPAREEVVEAKSVIRSVQVLTRELGGHRETRESRLLLLFRPNDKMAETIYTLSEESVAFDDIQAQQSFVESDLSSGARIVASTGDDNPERLFLITDTTSYQLRRFSDSGAGTWQVATVTSIIAREPGRAFGNSEIQPIRHPVELVSNNKEATRRLTELGAGALEWTLSLVKEKSHEEDPETRTLRHAILLIQVVEALLHALEILPVAIVGTRSERGRVILQIAPRESPRDDVARNVGERSTVDVMDRLFEKDDQGIDVEWRLSSSGGLGGRDAGDVSLRFESVEKDQSGRTVYEFSAFELPAEDDGLFLRKYGDHGTESLIRRRLRTTRALAEQRDLVTLFSDPRRNSRRTDTPLAKDEFYEDLDEAKQGVLEDLWTLEPSYFVVGPPGVGKTKLVSEVLRRKVSVDPAARVLVSTQSHQALDHILKATRRALSGNADDVIIVRSPGRDDAVSTEADVRRTAQDYLKRVRASDRFAEAPLSVQSGIADLEKAFAQDGFGTVQRRDARDAEGMRALTALVLGSANLVFSTSASADIERLIDESAQFDWAIIEEAAKATGPDLIAPLSLSGRRLFIGDHNQLPPFDTERMTSILSDQTALRNALVSSDEMIGPTFFESGLEEIRKAAEDDETLAQVSRAALRAFEPFRVLVEEDEKRRSVVAGARRSVSSELLVQHRMDPQIAELISLCFYKGRLKTSDRRTKEASQPLPFTFGEGFPTSPLVFIDMPYVSRTGKAPPVESGRPRWSNGSEARVIVDLLERLRLLPQTGDQEAPSLAVLAPYRAQVDRIERQIEALKAKGGDILRFKGFAENGRICGTVDASQGSEADLVLVSLVRNNPRTGVPALGFLRDRRRMNVLLSRGRQQLVLVGSLEFLRESSRHATKDPKDELSFVVTFLETIEALRKQQAQRGGPAATIITPAELLRRAR